MMYQHYDNANTETPRLERKVVLSATNTKFRPFYEVSPSVESLTDVYENNIEHKLLKTF